MDSKKKRGRPLGSGGSSKRQSNPPATSTPSSSPSPKRPKYLNRIGELKKRLLEAKAHAKKIKTEKSSPPKKKGEVGKGVFLVEKIVDKRIEVDGKLSYLIKWRGYADTFNSWEPEAHLNKTLIGMYNEKKTKPVKVEEKSDDEDEETTILLPTSATKKTKRPRTVQPITPITLAAGQQDYILESTPGSSSETNIHAYNSTDTNLTNYAAAAALDTSKTSLSITFDKTATIIQEKGSTARVIHVGLQYCDKLKTAHWTASILLLEISGPVYSFANLANLIMYFRNAKELRFNINNPNPEPEMEGNERYLNKILAEQYFKESVTSLKVNTCMRMFEAQPSKEQDNIVALICFILKMGKFFKNVTALRVDLPLDKGNKTFGGLVELIRKTPALHSAEIRTNVGKSTVSCAYPKKGCVEL